MNMDAVAAEAGSGSLLQAILHEQQHGLTATAAVTRYTLDVRVRARVCVEGGRAGGRVGGRAGGRAGEPGCKCARARARVVVCLCV